MADAARRQFHCAIVTWLLRRGLPPSVLEHPELQRAVRLLDPRASLPTPWDLVRQRVAADRTAVYTMTVSGASAPWTGVTFHSIDEAFDHCSFTATSAALSAPRAGEDAALRATLLDCVDPIALRPPQLLAVTSSDDHTQRYATDQLGGAPGFQRVASMACWGHKFHLSLQRALETYERPLLGACRKLAAVMQQQAAGALFATMDVDAAVAPVAAAHGPPEAGLRRQDDRTQPQVEERWRTAYRMVEALLRLKPEIEAYLNALPHTSHNRAKKELLLLDSQWAHAAFFVEAFEDVAVVSEALLQTQCTAAVVLPAVAGIVRSFRARGAAAATTAAAADAEVCEDMTVGAEALGAVVDDLLSRYHAEPPPERRALFLATALHPEHKEQRYLRHLLGDDAADAQKRAVVEAIVEEAVALALGASGAATAATGAAAAAAPAAAAAAAAAALDDDDDDDENAAGAPAAKRAKRAGRLEQLTSFPDADGGADGAAGPALPSRSRLQEQATREWWRFVAHAPDAGERAALARWRAGTDESTRKGWELWWWARHRHEYPLLARVARRAFSLVASCAPSEGPRALAGSMWGASRTRLSPELVQDLSFLAANRHLWTADEIEAAAAAEGAAGAASDGECD